MDLDGDGTEHSSINGQGQMRRLAAASVVNTERLVDDQVLMNISYECSLCGI